MIGTPSMGVAERDIDESPCSCEDCSLGGQEGKRWWRDGLVVGSGTVDAGVEPDTSASAPPPPPSVAGGAPPPVASNSSNHVLSNAAGA